MHIPIVHSQCAGADYHSLKCGCGHPHVFIPHDGGGAIGVAYLYLFTCGVAISYDFEFGGDHPLYI